MFSFSANQDEINELAALLDVALKAGGLQVLKPVHHWVAKLEAAEPDDELNIQAESI